MKDAERFTDRCAECGRDFENTNGLPFRCFCSDRCLRRHWGIIDEEDPASAPREESKRLSDHEKVFCGIHEDWEMEEHLSCLLCESADEKELAATVRRKTLEEAALCANLAGDEWNREKNAAEAKEMWGTANAMMDMVGAANIIEDRIRALAEGEKGTARASPDKGGTPE